MRATEGSTKKVKTKIMKKQIEGNSNDVKLVKLIKCKKAFSYRENDNL
jgi:hypothetical protein